MEPNRKEQAFCPVCCNALESNSDNSILFTISHTCHRCGYHYSRLDNSHAEIIGGHTITWDDSIYKPENMDLNVELEHLRNDCLAEAKMMWVEDKCNANETRGTHVCYKIVC